MYGLGTHTNEDIGFNSRDFGGHQMSILLAREVSSVQHFHPSDFDHEHGGSEHVTRVITPESNSIDIHFLVEIDGLDLLHALLDVVFRIQHLIRRYVTVKQDDL